LKLCAIWSIARNSESQFNVVEPPQYFWQPEYPLGGVVDPSKTEQAEGAKPGLPGDGSENSSVICVSDYVGPVGQKTVMAHKIVANAPGDTDGCMHMVADATCGGICARARVVHDHDFWEAGIYVTDGVGLHAIGKNIHENRGVAGAFEVTKEFLCLDTLISGPGGHDFAECTLSSPFIGTCSGLRIRTKADPFDRPTESEQAVPQ